MTTTLKNCPFCGVQPKMQICAGQESVSHSGASYYTDDYYIVECKNKHNVRITSLTEKGAIEEWNTRAEPESPWQTMDSAPKHERILMLMKHGAIEGCWDGETGFGYYWRDMEWYPTHWMPIPPPPKKEG